MKSIFFIFIFLVSGLLKSQTFFVGDTSCNYIRLNKIIHIANPGNFGSWSASSSYSIDCDQDFVNDIVFTKNATGLNTGSGSWSSTQLNCTSPNGVEFVYRTTTTSCSAGTANLVDSLIPFTPFNASLNLSITKANSWVYDLYFNLGNTFCGYLNPNPLWKIRSYIGFRKIFSGGDTIYGWILLNTEIGQDDQIISMATRHTLTSSTITPVFTNTNSSVCAGSTLSLNASPSGGNFYGLGISGNTFSSVGSTPSSVFSVYYTIGCANPAVMNVTVNALPNPAITNSLLSVCSGDSLVLTSNPSGGNFSGSGVTGNVFHSAVTGLGTTVLSYSYTDLKGCSNTTTTNINVVSTPSLVVTPSSTIFCYGQTVTLTANGASTYTWSDGSTTPQIIISPTTSVSFTLTGEFSSGNCPNNSTSYSNTVTIPPSLAAVPDQSIICVGNSVIITINSITSFPYVDVYDSISMQHILHAYSNTVVLTPTATTTYVFRERYNSFQCYFDIFLSIKVNACVGVHELKNEKTVFDIFPNPSAGEFEIKGNKEETIFISNELGQLIETKNLIKENNYSVKLSNLQSGIYFIGNKFSRQKIVVIK